MNFGGRKIIAIGDSNTYGFGAADVTRDGAWRYYFGSGIVPYLKAAPDWVGYDYALGNSTSGNRMCGAIGQRIDQIISTYVASDQFTKLQPDICLAMIGVNDCNQIYNATWGGGSIAVSIANMSTLMDLWRAACPTKPFVVAKLPPSTTSGVNDQIVLWNAALDTMVAARSDKAYIFTADLYTAFTSNASWTTDYMWNFLHYNGVGQQLIANTFVSTLHSNLTSMPRPSASSRRKIKPHTAALRYAASTATTLGASATLNTAQPWAVSFDINVERNNNSVNSILCLRTDQATPFIWLANQNNVRYIEFGSSANFNRLFPTITTNDIRTKLKSGWHQVVVVFDGVSRTAASSYALYIDGVGYPITSGTGLSASTDQNAIGAAVSGGSAGTLDMANLTIWNGGSVMSAAQVLAWYSDYIIPSGPTLIRRYEHTDASGSTLTDATGNQNGSIGAATWITSGLPTSKRSSASARSLAAARTQAA